jgi:hypothetical protein
MPSFGRIRRGNATAIALRRAMQILGLFLRSTDACRVADGLHIHADAAGLVTSHPARNNIEATRGRLTGTKENL